MVIVVEILSKFECCMILFFLLVDVQVEVEKCLKVCVCIVKVLGFCLGKVLMKMVVVQFGYQVEIEVLNDKVGCVFNDVVVENNLCVVGFFCIEFKISEEVGEGKLVFDVIFEVYLEVILGDLFGVEVEKIIVVVFDVEIDKIIDILCKQCVYYYVKGE